MCTAISVVLKDHYFGRNLDYEHSFGEQVTIVPRRYPFAFCNGTKTASHYAMIGMSLPHQHYPLFFDAVNEKGLGMAGLNFPDNAVYFSKRSNKENVASFEFIPWILTGCATVSEAEQKLFNCNITDEAFQKELPPTPLHWLLADKERAITLEQTKEGMKLYHNPVGVLTNNPPFPIQFFMLSNYLSVSSKEPVNQFAQAIELMPYSRGMGGLGLPGDLSSMSRFVKACFTKLNSVFEKTEEEIVMQFFHVLSSVYQQKGCVQTKSGFEMTQYSACCNADKGIYYYTTYYNSQIHAVCLYNENLESNRMVTYPLQKDALFLMQN